jgi:hypothetical protein
MRNNQENTGVNLHDALLDIARTADPLATLPGPNDWDNIGPEDFGPVDFNIFEISGDRSVFYPESEAGLQWAYFSLPEDLDRHGAKGFIVETKWIDLIARSARNAGLTMLDDLQNLETEKQNWWQQENQDAEWVEING